jgi:protein-S-isoprenylcysteine O-methyltransferase Ste14
MSETFFIECYVIGMFVGALIRSRYTRQYRQNTITENRRTPLDRTLLLLVSVGMLFIPAIYVMTSWLDAANYRLPMWAGWLGVLLFVAALLLLWRSHADLNRNWSPDLQLHTEQTLVTHGVYRAIRHPMYAAHWLWGVAQVLLLQNWIAGWAMLVCFVPLYLLRIRREEQMLLEHFGDAYHAYMQQTGRIIPPLRTGHKA